MMTLRKIRKVYGRLQRGLLLAMGAIALCLSVWAIAPSPPVAWGQSSNLTVPERGIQKFNEWLNLQQNGSDVDTAMLRLDGKRLFLVTALQVGEEGQPAISPVKQRVREIESKLQKFVRSDFAPDTLKVIVQTQNRLPVVYANETSLLTVTAEDADIYGVDLQTRADEVAQLLQQTLAQAKRERQPESLKRQSYLAVLVVLIVLGISFVLKLIQKVLRARRQKLKNEAKANLARSVLLAEPQNPPSQKVTTSLKHSPQHKQQRVYAFQQELLQGVQIGAWLAGGLTILGLFPQTRWLQLFLFTGIRLPLLLLGVGGVLYLMIRLSTLLIDRFFGTLEDGDFLNPENAQKWLTPDLVQRLALRVSTLSQVLKNVTAIVLSAIALLVSLSVIGVPLGPLVAGAGVVGLALSFAAQSVLKDSINGFLIFLEDQYGVGDWIVVGEHSGEVESMSLRITQLRNAEGALITLPNGDIRAVKNLSKNWARVDINVPIAYSANLMKAMELMTEIALEMTQDEAWKRNILEPPELKGADNFGDQGVIVKLWIKTRPLEQWNIAREYRRRLKLSFDHAGIPLPLPQQVLWVQSHDTASGLSKPPKET